MPTSIRLTSTPAEGGSELILDITPTSVKVRSSYPEPIFTLEEFSQLLETALSLTAYVGGTMEPADAPQPLDPDIDEAE